MVRRADWIKVAPVTRLDALPNRMYGANQIPTDKCLCYILRPEALDRLCARLRERVDCVTSPGDFSVSACWIEASAEVAVGLLPALKSSLCYIARPVRIHNRTCRIMLSQRPDFSDNSLAREIFVLFSWFNLNLFDQIRLLIFEKHN